MINYTEENAVKLSATKKDFYQIWNELLETASKISERWDPTSTNESDPGIVLLKVLTAVADKLNYAVDANTLEAFMPSAAQVESMRKLTDMLGYNMKYFRSATTDVQISYTLPETSPIDKQIYIERFTNIKDIDETINYVTLKRVYLNAENTTKIVTCMEGELVECETEDDNIISMLQLDDNNRYFLPETQVAENGIFVTSINDGYESTEWDKVDNLNTQSLGTHCFKFGFDSKTNLPYIQFPDDISTIIEDGLKIKYIRTKGASGNISAKTLSKLSQPSNWANEEDAEAEAENSDASTDYYNVDNYTAINLTAAKNGSDIETLTDAYNNYKRTIGTFDSLITCRDYMNKIYQMTVDDMNTTPLVSNIIVSDIRDDINKALTFCTFGKYGIEYNNVAKKFDYSSIDNNHTYTSTAWSDFIKTVTEDQVGQLYKVTADGDASTILGYYTCVFDGNNYTMIKLSTEEIDHFDLVFYPFKNTYGLNTKTEYVKSFKYDESNLLDIKNGLEENKTISHKIVSPEPDDIACIKNYYNLNAKITTNYKVNVVEQTSILANIFTKLYEKFNARQVDFGEELSYDAILETIQDADPRIKNVSLEDPQIETKFCTVAGGEFSTYKPTEKTYVVTDADLLGTGSERLGNTYYNKLVLNNVIAGRVPLFNYDENFKPNYAESAYPTWVESEDDENSNTGETSGTTPIGSYHLLNPEGGINASKTNGVSKLETELKIFDGAKNVTLNENEVVQFRLPNLKTIKTFPAYVNYYLHLNNPSSTQKAIPATMKSVLSFVNETITPDKWESITWFDYAVNSGLVPTNINTWQKLINGTNGFMTIKHAGVENPFASNPQGIIDNSTYWAEFKSWFYETTDVAWLEACPTKRWTSVINFIAHELQPALDKPGIIKLEGIDTDDKFNDSTKKYYALFKKVTYNGNPNYYQYCNKKQIGISTYYYLVLSEDNWAA